MSAAAAIVVSSSPPRVFARSPTPVDSSPSLPSPAELFRSDAEGLDRFRSARKKRDAFTTDFKGARTMLGQKKGAENVPFRSPGKERFKDPEPRSTLPSPRFILARSKSQTGPGGSTISAHDMNEVVGSPVAGMQPISIESNQATLPPSVLNTRSEKAIPRRLDWTPPQDRSTSRVESPSSPTAQRPNAFPDGLMRSFSYDGNPAVGDDLTNEPIVVKCTTKRKRINLVGGIAHVSCSKAKKGAINVAEKTVAKKGSRSPAKKAMTITRLATSHYFGLDEGQNESPMMQYLSATQARTMEDAAEDLLSGDRVFNVSEKSGTTKRRGQKSSLMSPQSAIKALELQATIFGSASQLARDEDPRQQPLADPISTQQTQPISIESTTPRTDRGTSRFMKTRNLWGVSARDDYNALLHIDSVDLFDTPNLRDAFAGKDVLLAPESRHVGVLVVPPRSPIDIDDLESPLLRVQPQRLGPSSSRSFHTSPMKGSKKALEPEDGASAEATPEQQQNVAPKRKKATPKKPSYAGLTTQDLQKQLSAFGFKPVKKREKMIELLEICWEQKHSKTADTVEAPKHGDFLTKVHDVSSRPQPKVKKPKRTKADQAEGSPKKVTKRQKKTAESGDAPPPAKRGRKKKSDAPPLSEAKLVDVDDVQSPAPVPASKDQALLDLHVPTITPPPTIPVPANEPRHKSDSRAANLDQRHTKTTRISSPPQSATNTIGDKIRAAIMKQSDLGANTTRNHILNPTWHEKILLYDPIILEDLTTWLNTEGLRLVGEDGEVSAVEVREWCEGEGVCCLWRGGWRGNGNGKGKGRRGCED